VYASAAVLAAVFAVRLLTPCIERRYSPFVRRNVLREMSKLANSLKKQGLQESFSMDFDPEPRVRNLFLFSCRVISLIFI
jgi:hypothetical protein